MNRIRLYLLLLAMPLLLAACGSGLSRYPSAGVLPPAPLPSYQVGDIYIFDGGYVEKVTDIKGDQVYWESYGGDLTYTTLPNFILPRLNWDTPKGRGVAKFNEDPNTLWPLQVGKHKRFFSEVTVTDKLNSYTKPFDQVWSCSIPGTRQVHVRAGVFDTWEVRCERSTFPNSKLMQERRWYYAPSVGHYVLREDMYTPTSNRILTYRSRQLVAFLPADNNLERKEAQAAEQHFQQALEAKPSGEDSDWVSADGTHRRQISLQNSFRAEDGKYCRAFAEQRQDQQRSRLHNGVACRSIDGRWRVAIATLPTAAAQP